MTSIRTTTAGSLPRTPELIAANAARSFAEDGLTLERTEEYDALVGAAVADVVERQRSVGITDPGDGEFGKAMSSAVDYGAWWSYSFQRVAGLALTDIDLFNAPAVLSEPGHIRLTSFLNRRDRQAFPAAYAESVERGKGATPFPSTVSELSYKGHEAVAADVRHLKAALQEGETGFITSIAPGSAVRVNNEFYPDHASYVDAWADAMAPEYRAIVEAGLTVQLDDPSLAENWDQIEPQPTVADYQAFTRKSIEAINRATAGLPKELLRLHLCWGSWHGPHTTDIELKDILPVVLEANVGSISFEAANVRHEHEWTVWRDIDIPEGLVLVPGIVSHATNVVEHPDLVAQRIERFVEAVGPERVIASTDCGLGGRVHPEIAWAKLAALGEGARRVTGS